MAGGVKACTDPDPWARTMLSFPTLIGAVRFPGRVARPGSASRYNARMPSPTDLNVRRLMTADAVRVAPDQPVREGIELMYIHRVVGLAVPRSGGPLVRVLS